MTVSPDGAAIIAELGTPAPAPGTAELTVADLEQYTSGRLLADDPETARLLAAALSACRSYCDWHVCPVRVNHEITLDGPCAALLVLPSLRIVDVTKVVEDGVQLDLASVVWSKRGLMRKTNGRWWTHVFSGITVTLTHGFDNAADFQSAVLETADRMSREVGGRLLSKAVGDVDYTWAAQPSLMETMLLDGYRLDPMP